VRKIKAQKRLAEEGVIEIGQEGKYDAPIGYTGWNRSKEL